MKIRALLLISVIFPCLALQAQVKDLAVSWRVLTNGYEGQEQTLSEFTFENKGKSVLPASGWAFYFCFTRPIVTDSAFAQVRFTHFTGDFYKLAPLTTFQPLLPGKSVSIRMVSQYLAISPADFPRGGYFVENGKPLPVSIRMDLNPENLAETANSIPLKFVSDEDRYRSNANLSLLPPEEIAPILPEPVKISSLEGRLNLPDRLSVVYSGELDNEAEYLKDFLIKQGFNAVIQKGTGSGPGTVRLEEDQKITAANGPESYTLHIDPAKGIVISGGVAGVFYGIQSLRSLMLKFGRSLPAMQAEDHPRFHYRGVMLDVARNFQSKETVLRLIDWLALYKFNTFHFHLADDEGWRLEINGLPELTAYGAFRGHTEDESDYLFPVYGSGPFAETAKSNGCGFYNRSSFIEILRYAAARHIEVIPELDFPGHARAAIKAMDYRYRKYMAVGDTAAAMEYLLRDTADRSVYSSAQTYNDNVVCVCREQVYHFLKKVTGELSNIYRDAGLTMRVLHIGDDEVPAGAWEKSPECAAFLAKHPEYPAPRNLEQYFVQRCNDILLLKGITTAGWEEIALRNDKATGFTPEVNSSLTQRNLMPYCWNSIPGRGTEDISHRLANKGFAAVQANATNLYLDMAYYRDPQEPGYYWANYITTETAFAFAPFSLPACPLTGKGSLNNWSVNCPDRMSWLTDNGKRNLRGIEACLWGENGAGADWVDFMLFPRLIAVAERAWSGVPAWETEHDSARRIKLFREDYNRFANSLGQLELPMLDKQGVKFRIPLPGTIIQDGKLSANVEFPGLPIRYSYQSDPGPRSGLFRKPLPAKGIRTATVMPSGRISRVTNAVK